MDKGWYEKEDEHFGTDKCICLCLPYINWSKRPRPRNESCDTPSGSPRPVFMTNSQKPSCINVPEMEVELNVLPGVAVHLAGFGGEKTGMR